jgi:MFS family permease
LPPAALYRLRAVTWGYFMWATFTLYALYVVRDAGLTPAQLLIVGIVLEFTVFVFEIPTGVLADAVSRRLSIIVGTAIAGAGWVVMGLFPSFEGIIAGQFLWGFGYTFVSGSNEAWLADEVGEDEAVRLYPQAAQWAQGARIAGVLTGAGLGWYTPGCRSSSAVPGTCSSPSSCWAR